MEKNLTNEWPDIYINLKSKKIYLDCIAPTVGNNEYKVPEMVWNGFEKLPTNEIKQRFKYAINEKIKKYLNYLPKGIVNKNDKILIALNTGCLLSCGSIMDLKDPLLLVFCKDEKIYEKYDFIDAIIYNHKSIFDYNNSIKLIIIKKDYTLNEERVTM